MKENHYVLVIHGTWNPPDAEAPKWHQLNESDPGNFCTVLNDELEALGQGRAVWRPLNGKEIHFGWCGKNLHEDRIDAGNKLYKLLQRIVAEDPAARIDIVAHSHGANVALLALRHYLAGLKGQGSRLVSHLRASDGQLTPDELVTEALTDALGRKPDPAMLEWPVSRKLREELTRYEVEREQKDANERGPAAWRKVRKTIDRMSAGGRPRRDFAPTFDVSNSWMVAKESNRIGRLVFMGAPFLTKRWQRRRWWSPANLVGHVIDFVTGFGLSVFGIYFLIEMLWTVYVWGGGSLIQLVHDFGWNLRPVLDPRSWQGWLQWTAGTLLVIYALIFFGLWRGWTRRDLNPYFDTNELDATRTEEFQSSLPFETLIVHAGLLDEVFLGFAAEPLVYGTLVPQVRPYLYPPLKPSIKELPLGVVFAPRNVFTRALSFVWRALLALLARLVWPLLKIWEKVLTNQLLELVSSPAFGLPAREFANATIVTSHRIGLPHYFTEVEWNVSRELADIPLQPVAIRTGEQGRYAFLWDQAERDKRLKDSWLWSNVATGFGNIAARYQGLQDTDQSELKTRLINTCLVLEERGREVIGAVELVHSAYYSNLSITSKVARFIVEGPAAVTEPRSTTT